MNFLTNSEKQGAEEDIVSTVKNLAVTLKIDLRDVELSGFWSKEIEGKPICPIEMVGEDKHREFL